MHLEKLGESKKVHKARQMWQAPPCAAAQLAEARARTGAGAGPEAQEGSVGATPVFCDWERLAAGASAEGRT